MFQSYLSPSIHRSRRTFMYSGYHASSSLRASNSPSRSNTRTNQCGRIWNSTGRCVRSATETCCSIFCAPRNAPAASRSVTICLRARSMSIPAYAPATSVSLPAASMPMRRSRPSRFHRCTSAPSPKVHTIMRPVPKSVRTSSSERIGTSCSLSGTTADWPASAAYRSSSGLKYSATQLGISSGRVVEITRSRPSGARKAMS